MVNPKLTSVNKQHKDDRYVPESLNKDFWEFFWCNSVLVLRNQKKIKPLWYLYDQLTGTLSSYIIGLLTLQYVQ